MEMPVSETRMIDHNVKPGPLNHCQICGSSDLELVLDCGHQPLCDSLLTAAQLQEPEPYFPLRQMRCVRCTLNQLDYVVEGSTVYHQNYPYRTGVTRELAAYQELMAKDLAARYRLNGTSVICDIGSNDGTLLKGFKQQGIRVLGIEPTQIASIAIADGIDTVNDFFNETVARDIVREYGTASLVTASNVFAHMAPLGDVVRGIQALIGNDGVFVLENHYLVDVLNKAQYDTIYHEHIRTYSLKSLVTLFGFYGMEVFHAERVSRYGGNIRAHVCHRGSRQIEPSVGEILKMEAEMGLDKPAVYEKFRKNAEKTRDKLIEFAVTAKTRGQKFVGNSCPGRANTLLHYCDIGTNLMPYIAEQPASLKKGLYSPGKHIPIVDNSILFAEQPDYVVLLAWHYAEPIAADLRKRGLKSKLIVPLPECKILDAGPERTPISVVVPVFNEEHNVERAYSAIVEEFSKLPEYSYEIIFTDNHSTDGTFSKLKALAASDPDVRVLRFSRNFGFHRSILTGYRHAQGAAAIQIDCDLEDPPSLFPEFLRLWREGHDVVAGVRSDRKESRRMIALRRTFYRLLGSISEVPHAVDAGDFRLVDRQILDQLKTIDDAQPYVRGLISELAANQTGVVFTRQKREFDKSKFPLPQLVRLAMSGILSYSIEPLRLATYLGVFISLLTAVMTCFYVVARLVTQHAWPSGFATITVLILFGISLNAIFLGVIGEYIGRIYIQARKRPTVIIEQALNIDEQ
jgi:glycosyltransferase involved in cell wall biosynthesis